MRLKTPPAPVQYHLNRTHGTITINPSSGEIVLDESALLEMLARIQAL